MANIKRKEGVEWRDGGGERRVGREGGRGVCVGGGGLNAIKYEYKE